MSDDLDLWAEQEHSEWVQQKMKEEHEEELKKARREGAKQVFDLIKKYHSPKSLGFELWNKIEELEK